MSDQSQKALEIKRKHESGWMKIDGVVAVGVGKDDGKTAIIISVEKDPGDIRKQIPPTVEGIPVVIKRTGSISAL